MSATILLAEDDEQLRELLKMVLESAGYRLLIANDAQEALELANRGDGIELLVSDIQMPGMPGIDLARKLKQLRPDIRILLISGYPGGVLMLDSGWRFLSKPFPPSAILEKVQEVMRDPPKRRIGRARRDQKAS